MSVNMAKVWNDNDLPFEQDFKGDKIKIPAKGYIEMEYWEGVQFKSAPSPMRKDGMGQQTRDSYKMIRVEGKPHVDNQVTAFKSHKDGTLHASVEALDLHEKQYSHLRVRDEPTQELPIEKPKPLGRPKNVPA